MPIAELYETELGGGATGPSPHATGEGRNSTHLRVLREHSILQRHFILLYLPKNNSILLCLGT